MPGVKKLRKPSVQDLKRTKFSRSNLVTLTLVVAGVGGYFLLSGSAANLSKTWDSDTELNSAALSNTNISGTGTAAKLQLSAASGGATNVPTAANIWIDATGGTCTRQNTAGVYGDAAACASMQTAITACQAGDIIVMKAGTYGSQTISRNLTSPGCKVIGENGTTIGGLSTTGDYAWVENVDSTGFGGFEDVAPTGSSHPWNVTWKNLTFRNYSAGSGDAIFIDGGLNFTWTGGGMHDVQISQGGVQLQGIPSSGTNNLQNTTLDHLTFTNITRTAAAISAGNHTEVIRIDDGSVGTKIQNSTFGSGNDANSATVFIGSKTSNNTARNTTLEQNFFGSSGTAFYGFDITGGQGTGKGCSGLTLSYNTWSGSGSHLNCQAADSVVIRGNVGTRPNGCLTGGAGSVTWSKNFWTNGTCGGTDQTGSVAYAGDGFHLAAGSNAIGKGDPVNYPVTDIDSGARVSPPDAGADQFGATSAGGTYSSSGTALYSFDAGQSASWTSLTASKTTPTGTTAILEARSSSDNSTWSGWVSSASVASLAVNRYIQVRVTLSTTDTSQTPSIDNISLSYATGTTPVLGDTNGDGHVNIIDLSALLTNYTGTASNCDFNNDGVVNILDLSTLLSHYGT